MSDYDDGRSSLKDKILVAIATPFFWIVYSVIWVIASFFKYLAFGFGWILYKMEGN